jgi:hypothetical protein
VETIHVELAYKGAEVTRFEPCAKRGLLLGWLINDSLLDLAVNDAHRMSLTLLGSFTILFVKKEKKRSNLLAFHRFLNESEEKLDAP